MHVSISRSVGVNGANVASDVRAIQSALNSIPASSGGPQTKLVIDGLTGPKTNGAIYQFQKNHFGASRADGRVDPNQRTLQRILELLQKAIGPDPPDDSMFTGFTDEQEETVVRAIMDARYMVQNAMSKCSIAYAMAEPNMAITSLRHNFDVDVKSDNPISGALQSTMLTMVQGSLARIRAGLEQDVPFVYSPTTVFPEAWVVGTTDATVHIGSSFFDDSFKTPLSRAATILHERAHTELKAPGHPGINDGGGLATLVGVAPHEDKRPHYNNPNRFFEDALRNPYNFEWLCVSLDNRYVPTPGGMRVSGCRTNCGTSHVV